MRDFHYRALSPGGETIQGLRSAVDAVALSQELAEQNLILLNSSPAGRMGRAFSLRSGASARDLREFTLHMATSLASGIPVVQALRDMEDVLEGSRFQRIVSDVREEISSGGRVAEALSHHPSAFPEVFVSLVEAGESSGKLDGAFEQLGAYLEWSDELKGKLRQALLYPTLLCCAAVGLFLLMVLYVIPRFMSVFQELDYELPALTRRVLAVGDFFGYWWPFLLGGIAFVVFFVKVACSYERGRYEIDRIVLGLPVFGRFVEKLALSRFARNFSLLLGSGVDILKVLALLRKVVGNTVLAGEIEQVRSRVMTGESLAGALAESERFPLLIRRLITVGETSGRLEETLARAAEHMDKEMPRQLKQLFTFMEVAVVLVIGGLIVTTALALLLPIFQIQGELLK